jgi:poly(A) polymerase
MTILTIKDAARETQAFKEAAQIVSRLKAEGFQAFFVGGCVRDLLLGLIPTDYDIATAAKPEEVQQFFPRARGEGRKFGVSLVPVSEGFIEVAAFREDGPYFDHRRPAWINIAGMKEDSQRRDFTINALYYDPVKDDVVDLVGGLPDLEDRLLRVIGDPFERLDEDWLRLLRAVRFAARFNLEIEFVTWDAVRALAPLVTGVSAERITEEIRGMLQGSNAAKAVGLLYTSGLWKALWPELPFSLQRLTKMAAALESDRKQIWKAFFTDLPEKDLEAAMGKLKLTKAEKKTLGLK